MKTKGKRESSQNFGNQIGRRWERGSWEVEISITHRFTTLTGSKSGQNKNFGITHRFTRRSLIGCFMIPVVQ